MFVEQDVQLVEVSEHVTQLASHCSQIWVVVFANVPAGHVVMHVLADLYRKYGVIHEVQFVEDVQL